MRKKYVLFFPYNYTVRGFADIGQSRHQVKFFFNFRKPQKKLFFSTTTFKKFQVKIPGYDKIQNSAVRGFRARTGIMIGTLWT